MRRFAFCQLLFLFLGAHSSLLYAAEVSVLSSSTKKAIASAQSQIDESSVYLKKSDLYLESIKELSKSSKNYTSDSARLANKYARTRLSAFDGIESGYNRMYSEYYDAVKEFNKTAVNTKASTMLSGASNYHSIARKQFRSVPNEMDNSKAVKSMNIGIQNEEQAIKMLRNAVDILEGGDGRADSVNVLIQPKIEETAVKQDTSRIKMLAAPTMVAAVIPVRVDSSAIKSDGVKSYDDAKTFFSIQIAASKNKLSQDEINGLYRGGYIVVLMEADGYFRYSVGKFLSVADAQTVIDREKIKGYIVGYLDNKRSAISVVTAALASK